MYSPMSMNDQYSLSLDKIKEIAEQPDHKLKVYLAALEYIACGFYLLPIIPGDKKLPRKQYNITYGSASKNRKVIERWFDPHSGQFAGWNVGIAGGRDGGVFIMDVDRHDDKNGFLSLDAAIKEHGELPYGPVQITPNGGKHYLFAWQEHAASTTDKIGIGIDTRGGTDVACKGHVVVWPSIVDGRKYEWETGGIPPTIPKWIMERLGVLWKNTKFGVKSVGRGNENVTGNDLEIVVDKDQIERMLADINPDSLSYDEWLRIGMSIKSQHPGPDGLEIWDNWSKEGTRYTKGECNVRWDGLDESGAVRSGTLFHIAKQHGWTPQGDDKVGNRVDELIASMNIQYAMIAVGGKIKILREKDIIPDGISEPYDLLDKESFRTLLMNDKMQLEVEGKIKNIPIADIWLAHEDRRTFPNGMGLYPKITTPPGCYNTWKGFTISPREGSCEMFLSHLKNIICGGNSFYYEWLLDWLADLFQEPHNPKGCAIVMRGEEGCGKGTLANNIGDMFGVHYRHLIDDSHLTSNFNAHLLDALVVFADEITWGGNKKTAGKLKGMVTEQVLLGERKGVDAVVYKNMIHMFIASNSDWVIPAGKNSRRWFVLDVVSDKVGHHKYFNQINDEMNNGGKEALLHMLLTREITHNLRLAPETKALDRQRCLSADYRTPVLWWSRCLLAEKIDTPDEKEFDPTNIESSWPAMVSKDALYAEYEKWCIERREKPDHYNLFASELREVGLTQSRPVINKRRVRVFSIPPLEEAKKLLVQSHPGIISSDDLGNDEGEENEKQ